MTVVKLKIIKKPLDKPLLDIKPKFPKLDNLNLDLLENKKKLKPGLPLIPIKKPSISKVISKPTISKPIIKEPRNDQRNDQKNESNDPNDLKRDNNASPIFFDKRSSDIPLTDNQRSSFDNKTSTDNRTSTDQIRSEFGVDSEDESTSPNNNYPMNDNIKDDNKNNKGNDTRDNKRENDDNNDQKKDNRNHNYQEPSREPPRQSQSPPFTEEKEEEKEEENNEPQLSPEEQEEEDRQEYLIRFKILKKSNKNYDFPAYTEHTDLLTLKRLYKDSLRMINLDKNVESYKTWLMAGFLGIELLGTRIGIDLKGFTKFQMKRKEKYDSLLVELGERSYSSFTSNWPVEVRLMGIILMDAAVFYLGKLISDGGGGGLSEIFGMLFGMNGSSSSDQNAFGNNDSSGGNKKNMRGPSVKAEDIKNMNKKES